MLVAALEVLQDLAPAYLRSNYWASFTQLKPHQPKNSYTPFPLSVFVIGLLGFPGISAVENLPANAEVGLIPGSGRSLHVFQTINSNQLSLIESVTSVLLPSVTPNIFSSFPMSLFFSSFLPGEGNNSPFQYSCLENPRGAWQGTAHRVLESDTTERLNNCFISSLDHCLPKHVFIVPSSGLCSNWSPLQKRFPETLYLNWSLPSTVLNTAVCD